jgi:hydroxylaminobenzene mutase
VIIFSTESQRRLIWHGMFLFLLGLLIGFAEGQVINPRMALAAHLEGLMNGTFLIAFHQLLGSTIARRHGKKA